MSDEARGPLLQRFDIDPRDERSVARMRLAIALVAMTAALVMLLGKLPVPVFLVALLGLLLSLAWLRQSRKLRARAAAPEHHYLELYAQGFVVADGPTVTWVPWREVRDIEVDEERLDIVVQRDPGGPLRVEPRYPGVAIHVLMDTLRNAWRRADDHKGGVPP